MCDTMVAFGEYTQNGQMLFAKNSDRSPNEPHQMLYVERTVQTQTQVQATYISIPQAPQTNAVFLFKPNWIWGAEMGVNEFGLAVGNEAVFTKVPKQSSGLTGMDHVRLVLERCQTAREGIDCIVSLLADYGQGGNCGYDHPFSYHNAYLLADPKDAWVLETAGFFWAAKQVNGYAAISNCLSIQSDYDLIHPDALAYAKKRRWCKNEKDFRFAECFTEPIYTHFSRSRGRRQCALNTLAAMEKPITAQDMKTALRTHEPALQNSPALSRASVGSVCMHAGGAVGDHTTGSLVAQISGAAPADIRMWATGASTPCFSVFKPLWFSAEAPVFRPGQEQEATAYWFEREHLHRAALDGKIDLPAYLTARDALEQNFENLHGTPAQQMQEAFAAEQAFVDGAEKDFATKTAKPLGSGVYRRYWRKRNTQLLENEAACATDVFYAPQNKPTTP